MNLTDHVLAYKDTPDRVRAVTQAEAEAAWEAANGPLDDAARARCAAVVETSRRYAGASAGWVGGDYWDLFGGPPLYRAALRIGCAWWRTWTGTKMPAQPTQTSPTAAAPVQLDLFGGP